MRLYKIKPEPLILAGLGAFEAPVRRRRKTICASNRYPFAWLRVDTCIAQPVIGRDAVPKITTAASVAKFVHESVDFGGRSREFVMAISLDAQNRPNAVAVPHQGGLAYSIVEVGSLLKPMILSNAVAMIMVHNHPSNEVSPSQEDVAITERVYRGAKLVGIKMLDSVVVGDQLSDGYYSFLDNGQMP